jgi:hypothetical protein
MRPLVLLFAAALAACPKLPPVSGCRPTVQECRAGEGHTDLRPFVCSASQRWEPAADRPCVAGESCVVLSSGRAACVPPGGVADAVR